MRDNLYYQNMKFQNLYPCHFSLGYFTLEPNRGWGSFRRNDGGTKSVTLYFVRTNYSASSAGVSFDSPRCEGYFTLRPNGVVLNWGLFVRNGSIY